MYLLDTHIVSELRCPRPSPAMIDWVEGLAQDQMFLSAVTIGEIQDCRHGQSAWADRRDEKPA